jgi:hypothetical protein
MPVTTGARTTLGSQQSELLSRSPELPLLRLLRRSRLPSWVFGFLWGLLLFAVMMTPFAALTMTPDQQREVLNSALFFSASFAIITGGAGPVFYGAADDLRRLIPVLALPEAECENIARGLVRATRSQVLRTLAFGALLGLLHSWLLGVQRLPLYVMLPQFAGTVMLWIFMNMTLAKLFINARVFSRLGALADPDLLRPSRHAAFGSAALRPALFLIGTMCAYVLLFIGDATPIDGAVFLGATLSLGALFAIVTLPLRGIRRRITERRQEILRELDARLEAYSAADLAAVPPHDLRDMDTILDMRERVAQAPGWPLDLAGVRRILLYIVLPPLTWAAAALVEMFIDGLV